MTIVSGKSLGVKRNCTSAELVEHVMALLRAMFPEEVSGVSSVFLVPEVIAGVFGVGNSYFK